MCFACGELIHVFKEYNLNCHAETKHAEKYKNFAVKAVKATRTFVFDKTFCECEFGVLI